MQYLIERQVFRSHWRLIIKFYASMSSLGTQYLKSDTISNLETWRDFINGFNDEYPLCYFIDAGADQETVEHKIRNQLALFFGHHDCQHTVLIGTPDGCYTGFLRQYMKSDDLCGRITVVEAIPFPGEVHDLSSRFLPPQKDSLFPIPTGTSFRVPPASLKQVEVTLTAMPSSPSISVIKQIPMSNSSPTPKRSAKPRSRASSILPRPIQNGIQSPRSGLSLSHSTFQSIHTFASDQSYTVPSPSPSPRRAIRSPTRSAAMLPSSIYTSSGSPKRSITSPLRATSILPSSSLNTFSSANANAKSLFDSAATRLQPSTATLTPSKPTLNPRSTSISSSIKVVRADSNPRPRSKTKPRSQPAPIIPLRQPSPPSQTPQSIQGQNQSQFRPQNANTIRRKPLAETQTRLPLPRSRNTFFNSKGQRVDSKAYVSMYTERYLDF